MESSADNDLLLYNDGSDDNTFISQESEIDKNYSKSNCSGVGDSRQQRIRQRNQEIRKSTTMWNSELRVNPDSTTAQPNFKRKSDDENLRRNTTTEETLNCCNDTSHQGIQGAGNCWSDIIDVILRIIAVIVFCTLEVTAPFQRDIHLEELWLYKNPRKPDIVTPQALLLSVIFCPFLLTLGQLYLTKNRREFRALSWVWTLTLCLNGIITSLLKVTVGRARPDFFYRCFPDGIMILANATNDPNAVATAGIFNCTGDARAINEGFKSFPSGHSSFAFASFGFISYFLAAKLHTFNSAAGRGATWRLVLTIAPLVWAGFVAVSRTCDYHHHWQDVTVGGLIGLVTSYTAYRQYYPSIFSRNCHRALPRCARTEFEYEYFWQKRKHYTPIASVDRTDEAASSSYDDELKKQNLTMLQENAASKESLT